MKISKLLAEYLLTRGCDQNGIKPEEYQNLDHTNVSVVSYQRSTVHGLSWFTIIVDTIGVLDVAYKQEDFVNGIGFHKHVLELENT